MPDPSLPPRMLSAPLRLTAMTLRGLGPYLHGARLEIKPLTILCGENGSGKSTWIEALKVVSEGARFPTISREEPVDGDGDFSDGSTFVRMGLHSSLLVNKRWKFFTAEETAESVSIDRELEESRKSRLKTIADEDQTKKYGQVGCVGIHADVIDVEGVIEIFAKFPQVLDLLTGVATSIAPTLGTRKAKLQLRWARPHCPTNTTDSGALSDSANVYLPYGLWHWVELVVEGRTTQKIRFREPIERGDPLLVDYKPSIEVTAASESPNSEQKSTWEEKDAGFESLRDAFFELFRTLMKEIVPGFFAIGPVRQIHQRESVDDAPEISHSNQDNGIEHDLGNPPPIVLSRYVGYEGNETQQQFAWWSYNQMRQTVAPFSGAIDPRFTPADFDWSKHDYGFGPRDNRQIEALAVCPEWLRVRILAFAPSDLRSEYALVQGVTDKDNQFAVRLLNSVLDRTDLYESSLWPNLQREAEELVDRGIDKLAVDEVRRLNRLLLEIAIGVDKDGRPDCVHRTGYVFETYVSYWLNKLSGTSVQFADFPHGSLENFWSDTQHPPNGELVHDNKPGYFLTPGPYGRHHKRFTKNFDGIARDVSRLLRPSTGSSDTAWHVMSTGFHQLAPIVVQAGLLRQNEIMLIETHSDLLVRRVLRAVREEDVGHVAKGQAGVAIHFTRLVKDEEQGFQHATIQQYETNSKGQIIWPDGFPAPGFMTDSLDEARRFVDAEPDDESDDGDDDE